MLLFSTLLLLFSVVNIFGSVSGFTFNSDISNGIIKYEFMLPFRDFNITFDYDTINIYEVQATFSNGESIDYTTGPNSLFYNGTGDASTATFIVYCHPLNSEAYYDLSVAGTNSYNNITENLDFTLRAKEKTVYDTVVFTSNVTETIFATNTLVETKTDIIELSKTGVFTSTIVNTRTSDIIEKVLLTETNTKELLTTETIDSVSTATVDELKTETILSTSILNIPSTVNVTEKVIETKTEVTYDDIKITSFKTIEKAATKTIVEISTFATTHNEYFVNTETDVSYVDRFIETTVYSNKKESVLETVTSTIEEKIGTTQKNLVTSVSEFTIKDTNFVSVYETVFTTSIESKIYTQTSTVTEYILQPAAHSSAKSSAASSLIKSAPSARLVLSSSVLLSSFTSLPSSLSNDVRSSNSISNSNTVQFSSATRSLKPSSSNNLISTYISNTAQPQYSLNSKSLFFSSSSIQKTSENSIFPSSSRIEPFKTLSNIFASASGSFISSAYAYTPSKVSSGLENKSKSTSSGLFASTSSNLVPSTAKMISSNTLVPVSAGTVHLSSDSTYSSASPEKPSSSALPVNLLPRGSGYNYNNSTHFAIIIPNSHFDFFSIKSILDPGSGLVFNASEFAATYSPSELPVAFSSNQTASELDIFGDVNMTDSEELLVKIQKPYTLEQDYFVGIFIISLEGIPSKLAKRYEEEVTLTITATQSVSTSSARPSVSETGTSVPSSVTPSGKFSIKSAGASSLVLSSKISAQSTTAVTASSLESSKSSSLSSSALLSSLASSSSALVTSSVSSSASISSASVTSSVSYSVYPLQSSSALEHSTVTLSRVSKSFEDFSSNASLVTLPPSGSVLESTSSVDIIASSLSKSGMKISTEMASSSLSSAIQPIDTSLTLPFLSHATFKPILSTAFYSNTTVPSSLHSTVEVSLTSLISAETSALSTFPKSEITSDSTKISLTVLSEPVKTTTAFSKEQESSQSISATSASELQVSSFTSLSESSASQLELSRSLSDFSTPLTDESSSVSATFSWTQITTSEIITSKITTCLATSCFETLTTTTNILILSTTVCPEENQHSTTSIAYVSIGTSSTLSMTSSSSYSTQSFTSANEDHSSASVAPQSTKSLDAIYTTLDPSLNSHESSTITSTPITEVAKTLEQSSTILHSTMLSFATKTVSTSSQNGNFTASEYSVYQGGATAMSFNFEILVYLLSAWTIF